MKAQFRRELDRSFARVPVEFGKPMYVPLDNLIPEVVIKIVTLDPVIPVATDDPHGWVVQPEDDVIYMPGGSYTLRLKEWGCIDFLSQGDKKKRVRSMFSCMSVQAPFTANFDFKYVTYRLQTGIIQSIVIDDYYTITIEEVIELSTGAEGCQHLGDLSAKYTASSRPRGKRSTARGKYKRQKYSYQPLIRR